MSQRQRQRQSKGRGRGKGGRKETGGWIQISGNGLGWVWNDGQQGSREGKGATGGWDWGGGLGERLSGHGKSGRLG